ncbi:MAG: aminodeoxychorismate lyase [Pseudomonadales bacterium]|nr:aminodeoxychorismate lyase [Pseudomonadales bacterium]
MSESSISTLTGSKYTWINGKAAEQLAVEDRAIAYGHGVFETVCVLSAKPQLWSLHLNRLASGCRRLYIPLDLNQIQIQLNQFLDFFAIEGDGVLKIVVTAGCGGRGYAIPSVIEPNVVLLWFAHSPAKNNEHQKGITATVCDARLARQPLLAGLKHLNRLEQVIAKQELNTCNEDLAEGIMLDTEGFIIEGVTSNLFMVSNGVLATPQLDHAGIAGVMRELILSKAESVAVTVEIGNFSVDSLIAAEEVFFCNSLIGVWPLTKLVGCGEPVRWMYGETTRLIQKTIGPYCFPI